MEILIKIVLINFQYDASYVIIRNRILDRNQIFLMDEKFINYKTTCLKNSEIIFKTFFHIVFLEICKSFELLPKGLSTKERLCFVEPSKGLKKEWKNGIDELDERSRDLLIQKHCKKLFNFMNIFWCDAEVDVNWLLKVKTNLDKLEKI